MVLISLIVLTMLLLLAPLRIWWRLWRAGSPTAGSLMATNGLLFVIGLARLLEIYLGGDWSVVVWGLALALAGVQLGLAVGVFGPRERSRANIVQKRRGEK